MDEVVEGRKVTFMKVDVQGGEMDVLTSAKNALSESRISLIQIEFSGEADVLKALLSYQYAVFDSLYLLMPNESPDLSGWDIEGTVTLSTGRPAFWAWPKYTPYSPDEYLSFLEDERQKVGNLQTDLIAVPLPAISEFLSAASRSIPAGSPSS